MRVVYNLSRGPGETFVSTAFILKKHSKKTLNLKAYVEKQIRYSTGNIPSVPLGLWLIYVLTGYGHLWYIVSFTISWFITVGVNFNMQKILGVIIIGTKKYDYISKIIRFYVGNVPLIFIGNGVLYGLTEYIHAFYIISSVISLFVTTIVGMIIQILLRVIRKP